MGWVPILILNVCALAALNRNKTAAETSSERIVVSFRLYGVMILINAIG
jgi:hypothetical protein